MKPEINKFADVPLRVKTWVYIILVFAVGISHPIAMKILISFLAYQSCNEFLQIFKIKVDAVSPSLFASWVLFFLLYFLNIENYFYTILVLLFPLVLFLLLMKIKQKTFMVIGLAIFFSFVSFPFLSFIRDGNLGLKSILFLVVVTELNDVFQYLMGKFFGKHKTTPKISPNKTWEGFVGGVFLTIILSNILGYFLLSTSIFTNSILGLILGVSGFFGDIFMSLIKRKANVKDTGNLLPGHGGLLDRMDSLIFNAPIFFWTLPLLLKVLNHG